MKFTIKVIPSRTGNIGRILLNNPKSLNALDLEMVRFLNDLIPTYGNDSALRATILSSNNENRKSFSAGGDVKSVYMAGMGLNGNEVDLVGFKNEKHGLGSSRTLTTAAFFAEEYQLNYKISNQAIPQISVWDGIVMGGGVGLSIHGKYRVATEDSLFAMPETKIGFFPDVGMTHVLSRFNGGVGAFIGLTGSRLKADDLMYTGLSTHYIPSRNLPLMIEEIEKRSMEDPNESQDFVEQTLLKHHHEIPKQESYIARNRGEIDLIFAGKERVEDILIELENRKTSFSYTTLETLMKMSPTSLKITLEGLNRSRVLNDLGESLKMEYRISQNLMRQGSDFYEGIRAALIDKCGNPKWFPDKIDAVTKEMVESCFESLGENELDLQNSQQNSKL